MISSILYFVTSLCILIQIQIKFKDETKDSMSKFAMFLFSFLWFPMLIIVTYQMWKEDV